jgi:hypothetical protein
MSGSNPTSNKRKIDTHANDQVAEVDNTLLKNPG